MQYETVREFIDDVGRRDFERDLGVTTQVVSRAISVNEMPSAWARDVRAWCVARGTEFPENLFKWRDMLNSDVLFAVPMEPIRSGGCT